MANREQAIHASVVDYIKIRLEKTKFYTYSIKVRLQSGKTYIIYRRFRQFNGLLLHLERRFPLEAGTVSPQDRVLPRLPGKIVLGRSAVREVAVRRLPLLDRFIQDLLRLHHKISQDELTQSFLRRNKDDSDLEKRLSRSGDKPCSTPQPTRRKFEKVVASPIRRNSEPNAAIPRESLAKLITADNRTESDSEDELTYGCDHGEILNYHYNNCINEIEVGPEFFFRPRFEDLFFMISDHIGKNEITLNYRDYEGDFVAILSEEDLIIMMEEFSQGIDGKTDIPWQIYVTDLGDFSSYNTEMHSSVTT